MGSGSHISLWRPCHSVVKVEKLGLPPWRAIHTVVGSRRTRGSQLFLQTQNLNLLQCLIKASYKFPKFQAEDLVYKVLTLKRFPFRHPQSAHCQGKPSLMRFETTWLPDSVASRQHGFSTTWLPNNMASQQHGFPTTWLSDSTASRQHGFRTNGLLTARLLNSMASRQHGF